ncbi:Surfeit locus 1 family protein [Aureimonas sp. Leaf460]|uniref:SURF1 family protein n=1 Tax=Aureimonas sp. Leaf460 TaxID=1736384 RepID=UPI000700E3F1|nr:MULTISPECIES: SURF1 family protein [unclassified Aureimonas]KQT60608.1 Surfeit locus 1 family protein [Aureimonas sp. Leaf427]KQT79480.1 Surfeit locus 1 family protein [Aureimonas sp. Leaf460]
MASASLVVFLALLGLGTWQVQRLAWKTDLVARVDARLSAEPVEAPGPAAWTELSEPGDAYRRVRATGTFLNDRETLVQALTTYGSGYWVMTPLRRDDGSILLVNRGFVPLDRRDREGRTAGSLGGTQTVSGLLRMSEPGGGFLRANDPAGDRWYSRDVAAIAASRLPGEAVAPYFVDADATPNPGGLPVGGLTVVSFRNHHLVYALTWYGLAALLAGAMIWVLRDERRRAGFSSGKISRPAGEGGR